MNEWMNEWMESSWLSRSVPDITPTHIPPVRYIYQYQAPVDWSQPQLANKKTQITANVYIMNTALCNTLFIAGACACIRSRVAVCELLLSSLLCLDINESASQFHSSQYVLFPRSSVSPQNTAYNRYWLHTHTLHKATNSLSEYQAWEMYVIIIVCGYVRRAKQI